LIVRSRFWSMNISSQVDGGDMPYDTA